MGIPLGTGSMVLGSMAVTVGSYQLEIFGADPRTSRDRAAITVGSILLAGGAATLIYSGIKLKRNRDSRRRVCGTTQLHRDSDVPFIGW